MYILSPIRSFLPSDSALYVPARGHRNHISTSTTPVEDRKQRLQFIAIQARAMIGPIERNHLHMQKQAFSHCKATISGPLIRKMMPSTRQLYLQYEITKLIPVFLLESSSLHFSPFPIANPRLSCSSSTFHHHIIGTSSHSLFPFYCIAAWRSLSAGLYRCSLSEIEAVRKPRATCPTPGHSTYRWFSCLDYRSHRARSKAECPKEQTHYSSSAVNSQIPHITPIARNNTKLSY